MTPADLPIPLLGFSAYSGTGKTTLLKQVLPLLRDAGLRVTVIKHAHHSFDPDQPGKDSYELRKAGADCCVVISRHRVAVIEDFRDERPEPRLADALDAVDPSRFDLVVVEGFKHEHFPKIELCRPALGLPLLFPEDDSVVAVAADAPLPVACSLPQLNLNRSDEVCDFVLRWAGRPSIPVAGTGVT